MQFEFFTSVMTPGIALLILSTTMRLGNVRLALTELAKIPHFDLENKASYTLFRDRAAFLCTGLRLLNISMLMLIPSAVGKLMLDNTHIAIDYGIRLFDVAFFIVLFLAVYNLFKESQLTGRSIIAHTSDIQLIYNQKTPKHENQD